MEDNLVFEEDQKARLEWLRRRSLSGVGKSADTGAIYAASLDLKRRRSVGLKEEVTTEQGKWTPPDEAGESWSCIGPPDAGGRIRSLVIHPNGRTLYAGAATGGVWRSDDEGESWRPLMHDQDSLAIGALAIDPSDPNIIYAGTGEPYVRLFYAGVGILKSLDGGESWRRVGPSGLSSIARVLVDPNNPDSIYCAGTEGLFCSPDRGKSWRPLCLANVTDLKIRSSGEIYIGVYAKGLFKSRKDGGWTQLGSLVLPRPQFRPLLALTYCPYCGSELIHARLDDCVFTSFDGGNHWIGLGEKVSLQGDPDWASLLIVHPLRPQQVFVGGVNLYRFSVGCGENESLPLKDSDLFCSSCPTDRSGGPSEQPVDQHDLAFHPENADIIYAANDAGVFRSVDGGNHWSKRSNGLNVTQFYDLAVSPHDPQILGGGTQDRGTWIYREREWTRVLGNDGGHLAFDPTDEDTAWGQRQANDICRIDLGYPLRTIQWRKGLIADHPIFIGVLLALASQEGDEEKNRKGDVERSTVLFTGRQHVFRDRVTWRASLSAAGGVAFTPANLEADWKRISPPVGGDVTAITIDPGNQTLVVGSSTGQIWRSLKPAIQVTSCTGEWVKLTPDKEQGGVSGVPSDWPKRRHVTRIIFDEAKVSQGKENAFYVCFGGLSTKTSRSDHVWHKRSRDSKFKRCTGSSGEETFPLPNIAAHGLVIDQRNPEVLYVCNDIGVFRSIDGGRHWHDFSEGIPNVPCFDMHLYQNKNDPSSGPGLLRVATHGRGIYELKI